MIVCSTIYSRHRSKKTSKLRVTGLHVGNSPVTGEFPAQRASNAENVFIWWRHHVVPKGPVDYKAALLQMMNGMVPSRWQAMSWINDGLGYSHICVVWPQWVNSSPPSAAYMRQWTGSTMVQVRACRMFGTKPLPKPMLICCQLDFWEQISVKSESEFYHFH